MNFDNLSFWIGVLVIVIGIVLLAKPILVAKLELCRFGLHDWGVCINKDASGYYHGCLHCKTRKYPLKEDTNPYVRYVRQPCYNGLGKVMEECGELIQVAAKKVAFFDQQVHPDGSDMNYRLEEEMGDVLAAVDYASRHMGLDMLRIKRRKQRKLEQYDSWRMQDDIR